MNYVTKSLYIDGYRCTKSLWLSYRDITKKIDSHSRYTMSVGNEIDRLSRGLFPNGLLIGSDEKCQSNDKLFRETMQAIEHSVKCIFQGTFIRDNILCKSDILERNGSGWDLYEVKMGVNKKDIYLSDIAFQVNCIERCGLHLERINLIILNREYVKDGQIDLCKLFKIIDVTEEVRERLRKNNVILEHFQLVIKQNKQPVMTMGSFCKYPYKCGYYERCSLECGDFQYGNSKIDRVKVLEFIKKITFPIHFFDFETIQSAIPFFDGTSPYQTIPFQFSNHTLFTDMSIRHYTFLADSKEDPRLALIINLLKAVGSKGSVLAWNASFERNIINKLADTFPEYQQDLKDVASRIVDLMNPFIAGYYTNPEFKGSSSLKAVLPVLVPELSYEDIAIHNGSEAFQVYEQFITGVMLEEEWGLSKKNLIQYCSTDTLGMLKIWQVLNALL